MLERWRVGRLWKYYRCTCGDGCAGLWLCGAELDVSAEYYTAYIQVPRVEMQLQSCYLTLYVLTESGRLSAFDFHAPVIIQCQTCTYANERLTQTKNQVFP